MSASIAVVPRRDGSPQPDISWIKKNVSVLAVGRELGLRIRNRRAKCWRLENHAHGDADPSLHFYESANRVRCFVCDMVGGHSCVDLVMGYLGIDVGSAVRWIAERFPVPNIKPGRPLGRVGVQPAPYRAGVSGSDLEVLVRSGMFGQLSSAESRILVTLAMFRDPESGVTGLSYGAIMRYSGVRRRASVSGALRKLQRLRALQKNLGQRLGITRECSTYRVTLDDPKFCELCKEVFRESRETVAQERAYRSELRKQREKKARDVRQKKQRGPRVSRGSPRTSAIGARLTLNTTEAGGLRPPDHPFSSSAFQRRANAQEKASTCEGLNLSSPRELDANRSVPAGNREIAYDARRQLLRKQAKEITAKYGARS